MRAAPHAHPVNWTIGITTLTGGRIPLHWQPKSMNYINESQLKVATHN